MPTAPPPDTDPAALTHARHELLEQLDRWLETPMLLLGGAWLVLLILDLTRGLTPLLEAAGTVIWGLFVLDFALKLILAPRKGTYLRRNWLTVVALLVPALRVLRIARVARLLQAARATRGIRLVRVLTTVNRGMKALGASMQRRGLGYLVALTFLVLFAGAAGMYAFEQDHGLHSYPEALWWTAMLLTSLGSEYWPQTGAGRLLCFLLGLYGFGVFGYVTAALASFFVGRDAASEDAETAGTSDVQALRADIAALVAEVQALRASTVRQP